MNIALIIEDDKSLREMMANALRGAGFNPHMAGTGEEGCRLALELLPQVIVTDIQLPDFSGFEVCRQIRARSELRAARVLMVTGTYTKDEDKMRAETLGADAYLLKPFHLAEFILIVRRLAAPS